MGKQFWYIVKLKHGADIEGKLQADDWEQAHRYVLTELVLQGVKSTGWKEIQYITKSVN